MPDGASLLLLATLKVNELRAKKAGLSFSCPYSRSYKAGLSPEKVPFSSREVPFRRTEVALARGLVINKLKSSRSPALHICGEYAQKPCVLFLRRRGGVGEWGTRFLLGWEKFIPLLSKREEKRQSQHHYYAHNHLQGQSHLYVVRRLVSARRHHQRVGRRAERRGKAHACRHRHRHE